MDTLATRIRTLRTEQGLSLRGVARDAQISPAFVVDIESGRRTPGPEVLERLAPVLGVPVGDLQALSPPGPARVRRTFDAAFRERAVQAVRESGKPVRQAARDLALSEATLGSWVAADKRRRGDGAEPLRLALAGDRDALTSVLAGLDDGTLERLGKAAGMLRDATLETMGRRQS